MSWKKTFIILSSLILIVSTFILVEASWSADNNNLLMAYFKMDEGSGNYSLNEINGSRNLTLCYASITDICANWSTGKIGNSIWFDSTQSEKVTTEALFEGLGLSKAFRVMVYRAGNDNAEWVVKGGTCDGNYKGFGLYFNASGSPWFFGCSAGDFSILNYSQPKGVWYEYVIDLNTSLSTQNITIYVNGTKVLEKDMQNNINTGISGIILGSYGTSNYLNGSIDEFAVWNRSISESEVTAIISSQYYNQSYYPSVTLSYPDNNTYITDFQVFECNVSDDINIKNVTLYIWNSTNDLVNTTLTNTISGTSNSTRFNMTFDTTGTYYWNCFVENNRSYYSFNKTNKTINIDLTNPVVTLNYPDNYTYFNTGTNINLNCTATGLNLSSIFLYGDFNGSFSRNLTNNSILSGNITHFKLNLSDSLYNWTCMANKTTVATLYPSFNGNYSVIIDTRYPNVTLDSITTTQGSQTISFNSTEQDSNSLTCKYSIFDSTGAIDGTNNNVSFTCNTNPSSATVTAYGTYNMTIYSRDLAGNENSSTLNFTTSASSGGTTTGGGGGGSSGTLIPVIGLAEINGSRPYSELEREIIYSSINSFCSYKIRKETLAIADYSKECSLGTNDLESIKNNITMKFVSIIPSDLTKFYQNYKNSALFQGFATQEQVKSYDLFTSVLGLTTYLQLIPPSIDTPVIVSIDKNYTIKYSIVSNKPLATCEVVSSTPDLKCYISNSTIKITYDIKRDDFFSKIYSGVISVTTDAPSEKIEQKKVSVNFRVYNLNYKIAGLPFLMWVIILAGISLVFGALIYSGKIKLKGAKKFIK